MEFVWYLNMVGLKKNWRVALMKNYEDFHKSIAF